MKTTNGVILPGMELSDLVGKLIVIEGTDGVGRSTQIALLKEWLEQKGHAVLDTGLSRSGLVGKGIKRAKEGHTLGRITLTLFYGTDFSDRLEHEIVPALRAGTLRSVILRSPGRVNSPAPRGCTEPNSAFSRVVKTPLAVLRGISFCSEMRLIRADFVSVSLTGRTA